MTTTELEAWSDTPVDLPPDTLLALRASGLVKVQLGESSGVWRLITDSRIGVLRGDDWEIRVRPRLEIPRLMFLLGYASDARGWRNLGPSYDIEDDLFAAVAHGFAIHAERALTPAPIRGYLSLEDQSTTLRGRIRVADQIARWPGLPLPLELNYDDHVIDVPENRLIRGASELLLRLPHLAPSLRAQLLRIRATLEDVTPAQPDPRFVTPAITRLNDRYRGAVTLGAMILRHTSVSTTRGAVSSVAFVFDMNKVFEDFLAVALTRALQPFGGAVRLQYNTEHLDSERHLRLKPDITWWRQSTCCAVIDAKYKALTDTHFPNADAYQMLAYMTAFDLDRGYLVYAQDEAQQNRQHKVRGTGKLIQLAALDVEQEPVDVLAGIEKLAARIASDAAIPVAPG